MPNNPLVVVATVFLGFPVYFLPAFIAAKRNHPDKKKLLYWNLFTGWTLIGWAVVMILAAKGSAYDGVETEGSEENQ